MNKNRKHYRDLVAREFQSAKRAGLPSTDMAYERVLVRLGMGVIQEQLPEIMPYFVGSSFLDKSEDGRFAAGFFVFDLQGSVCDIPIFLIDGKVKGYQLLFLRSSKTFLPARSEVIDFVLNQQRRSTGSVSYPEGEVRDRSTAMNTRVYSDQNRYLSKNSSLNLLPDVLESFRSIADSPETGLLYSKLAGHRCLPSPDWIELLQNRKAAGWLYQVSRQSPRLAGRVEGLLGKDWVTKLSGFFEQRSQAIRSTAGGLRFGQSGIKFAKAPRSVPEFFMLKDLSRYRTDIDRQDLVDELNRYGAVFEDNRPVTTKVAMLVQEANQQFTSPVGSGQYKVVMADGSAKQCFVVLPADQIKGAGMSGDALVISGQDRAVGRVVPNELAVESSEQSLTLPSLESSLSQDLDGSVELTAGSVRFGQPAIIITRNGKFAGPLVFEKRNADDSFSVSRHYLNLQGSRSVHSGSGYTVPEYPEARRVDTVAIDSTGELTRHRVTSVDDSAILTVPTGCRVLYIGEPEQESNDSTEQSGRQEIKEVRIMPISDLSVDRLSKQASFTARQITPGFLDVSGRTVQTSDFIYSLMASGLSKQASLQVADRITHNRQSFLIADQDATIPGLAADQSQIQKLAYQDGRDPNYQFGEPSSQEAGTSDSRIPVRQVQPVNERIPTNYQPEADTGSPPWSSENSDYSQPGVIEGDQGAQGSQEAQQLAETPDQVFENTLFIHLSRYVNPQVERERLISGLFRTCDTAGRGLFLLYSHGEEFAELYGETDSDDMENQLLTVFEVAGKQLVTMFNRSITTGQDLQMTAFSDS